MVARMGRLCAGIGVEGTGATAIALTPVNNSRQVPGVRFRLDLQMRTIKIRSCRFHQDPILPIPPRSALFRKKIMGCDTGLVAYPVVTLNLKTAVPLS